MAEDCGALQVGGGQNGGILARSLCFAKFGSRLPTHVQEKHEAVPFPSTNSAPPRRCKSLANKSLAPSPRGSDRGCLPTLASIPRWACSRRRRGGAATTARSSSAVRARAAVRPPCVVVVVSAARKRHRRPRRTRRRSGGGRRSSGGRRRRTGRRAIPAIPTATPGSRARAISRNS
jgi:hypothetical protein